jgi:two-component system sensor histidine kinase KdpD
MQRRLHLIARWATSIGLVLLVTAAYSAFLPVNPTTVALTYVVLILLVASAWGVVESLAASVASTICLNVFFLPPVGTLTIADPQNWIALAAFLATGIVASQLSGRARRRNVEALARQRDLERLYALSRGLLLSPGRPSMPAVLARQIADTFDFPIVAVYDHTSDAVAWAGPGDSPRSNRSFGSAHARARPCMTPGCRSSRSVSEGRRSAVWRFPTRT